MGKWGFAKGTELWRGENPRKERRGTAKLPLMEAILIASSSSLPVGRSKVEKSPVFYVFFSLILELDAYYMLLVLDYEMPRCFVRFFYEFDVIGLILESNWRTLLVKCFFFVLIPSECNYPC